MNHITHPVAAPIGDTERLWHLIEKGEPDACWLWQGAMDSGGYGVFGWGGRKVRATRAVWMAIHGGEIQENLYVCHTCDHPPCCNPAHLFLGTAIENYEDAKQKGRLGKFPPPPGKGRTSTARIKVTTSDVPCPHCQSRESKVVDSRGVITGAVRRRRACQKCGKRFTTYENCFNIARLTRLMGDVRKIGKALEEIGLSDVKAE